MNESAAIKDGKVFPSTFLYDENDVISSFSFGQLVSLLYDLLLKSCHRALLFKKMNVISFYRIIIVVVVMITMKKKVFSLFTFSVMNTRKKRSTEKLIGEEDAKMCEGKNWKNIGNSLWKISSSFNSTAECWSFSAMKNKIFFTSHRRHWVF